MSARAKQVKPETTWYKWLVLFSIFYKNVHYDTLDSAILRHQNKNLVVKIYKGNSSLFLENVSTCLCLCSIQQQTSSGSTNHNELLIIWSNVCESSTKMSFDFLVLYRGLGMFSLRFHQQLSSDYFSWKRYSVWEKFWYRSWIVDYRKTISIIHT